MTNFSAVAAFDVETKFAFAGDEQNVEAVGQGRTPAQQGVLDTSGIPIDLKVSLDSLLLDESAPLADIGTDIPAGLAIPDPISVAGTVQRFVRQIAIAISSDLTADRVAYAEVVQQARRNRDDARGERRTWTDQLEIASANLKLVGSGIDGEQIYGRRPSTIERANRFQQLQPCQLEPDATRAAGYGLAGMSEIHGTAKLDNSGPVFDATVTLKQVALKLWPVMVSGISNLNGTIV